MLWIIYRKTEIPENLYYYDWKQRMNGFYETPLMLYIRYRNKGFP